MFNLFSIMCTLIQNIQGLLKTDKFISKENNTKNRNRYLGILDKKNYKTDIFK